MIPTETEMTNPEPPHVQAHQEPITQEEENHPILTIPTDAVVKEWHWLAEGGELVAPPTLLQTANNPTKGPTYATQHARKRYPLNIEGICTIQHGIQSLADHPNIFDLLNTENTPEAKDHLKTLITTIPRGGGGRTTTPC